MRRQRRAKIVATLGPASSSTETIHALFNAGADLFRLNFSHGVQADHAQRLATIRELERETGRPIGVLLDLQGPPSPAPSTSSRRMSNSPSTYVRMMTVCATRPSATCLPRFAEIAARRGVKVSPDRFYDAGAAPCDVRLQQQFAAIATHGIPVRYLPSGAGHDAMVFPAVCPTAMPFARCGNNGISHHPDETMTAEDADLATSVLLYFFEHFEPPR